MLDILSLPNWTPVGFQETHEAIYITAKCDNPPKACLKCGVIGHVYRHGPVPARYRDSPMRGLPVVIEVQTQRYRCRACGGTFLQELTGVRQGMLMTERCASLIATQCLRDTFVQVAENIGCDEKTVRTLAMEHIVKLNSEYRPRLPEWLGVDETQIDGVMRCVITDVGNRKPVDMLPDRSKQTLALWLHQFKDRSMVKAVSTDMWKPYRDVVALMLPGVPLVVDKFHIVRTANYCMERVRIKLQKTKKAGDRRVWLMSKHILNKRYKKLRADQREKLDAWLEREPLLGQAYRLKEAFYAIFDMPKEKGIAAFDAYASQIPAELEADFATLTTSMQNWRTQILAYFDDPITNAYTEALNGVAKVINREGRGYSFEVLRARLLFLQKPRRKAVSVIPRNPMRTVKTMLAKNGESRCQSCRGLFEPEELQPFWMPALDGKGKPKRMLGCGVCVARFHTDQPNEQPK